MAATKQNEHKFNQFVASIYDVSKINDDEFRQWVAAYSYKGFDRGQVLIDLQTKVADPNVVQQIILICGLNGPKKAFETKLINGRTLSSYGIGVGLKGREGLTCSRITAATADLCAFFLKRLKFRKRVVDSDLPGWLQFPSAGSIRMNARLREQHRDFSIKFSKMIGGEFNEMIYDQMVENAYLDANLNLF